MKEATALQQQSQLSETEKICWLRLARTENIGPITFRRLREAYGTPQKILEKLPDLSRRGGRSKPLTAPPLSTIEHEYEHLTKAGGDIICLADDQYPSLLAALDDAPPVISIIGNPALAQRQCIAVVGSRNASLNGRKFTEKLATDLGKAGMTVVSGLARGIDTAAHEGSLAAGTIAVVAGGIDIVYPPENQKLYEKICETGLVIAESPLGQQPFAQSFPRRNRIVSGLSQGVIVVEANFKSGSLITARLAGEQGRDVFAVPGHPLDPRAEGTNALIRDGATLIRNADDILEALNTFSGRTPTLALEDHAPAPYAVTDSDVDSARNDLLQHLSYTPVNTDELIRATRLSAATAQIALLELELGGKIQRLSGNRVVLASS